MTGAHRIFDNLLFALLLAIPFIEWRWVWPRFLARVASGEPNVRMRFYRAILVGQWLIALALIAWWVSRERPWALLLLGPSTPLRLGIGLALALAISAFLYWQRVQILKREDALAKVRPQLESAAPLLPHNDCEMRRFRVVSVTAGVCEELLFRGFLIWYFAVWTGPIAAIVLSSIVFGLGHLYLGPIHVLKTAAAGLFFACLVVASGSLWPAILIHASMDWNSGEIGFRILSASAADAPSA